MDRRGALVELKGVDTQDGLGLAWLAEAGVRTGVISGRVSAGFAARARLLKMRHVVQGTLKKLEAFDRILRREGLTPAQAAFVGDDLPDLPPMRRAGLAVAVANARPEVRRAAHYVTRARGGQGALRELAEMILRAQGRWPAILRKYR